MKLALKIFFIFILVLFILVACVFIYFSILVKDLNFDKNKLINLEKTVDFYDNNDAFLFNSSNGQAVEKIENIPTHTQNAFIAIEDKRFYKHSGVDYKGLLRATFNNLTSLSFKEGASTISQQLIKNTHLSNEKTLKRKVAEVKLAKQLEKELSKREILEIYLNTIYFGNGCYGIKNASKYYFDKSPSQLTLNESAILAAIIKAPSNYAPNVNIEKCNERKNLVLNSMLEQSLITNKEYSQAKNEKIALNNNQNTRRYDYFDYVKFELDQIIKDSPYKYKKLKIYTNFDQNIQENIENTINNANINYNFSSIVCDNHYNLVGYLSTHVNPIRQAGSIIKPLLCYAPAVELDLIEGCTPLLDEKTSFNGYAPSNYGDKYYGYVSARESLSKSSNVCAVKLLNYVGIDKAKSYLEKLDLNYSQNDNSLSLALGSSEKGLNFNQLVNAYSIFQNCGNYKKMSAIKKITTENGQIIYQNTSKTTNVFSNETTSIMNDMLFETAKSGTAKKLSTLNYNLYAKTGTVGNNTGNTDAYCISYSKDYLIGVWIGNKDKNLLANSITGGSLPTTISYSIWQDIYKNNYPDVIETSDNLSTVKLDKIAYDNDHCLVLADKAAPERYVLTEKIKNPAKITKQSNSFSNPKIEKIDFLYNNNVFSLSLCHAQYIGILIFRSENCKKEQVFDSSINGDYFIDSNLIPNRQYTYTYIPYYKNENVVFYGKEEKITTIKTPAVEFNDWWEND